MLPEVQVIALVLLAFIIPPLVKDVFVFGCGEWKYYRFKALYAGEQDSFLPQGWTPSQTTDLKARLIQQQDRTR